QIHNTYADVSARGGSGSWRGRRRPTGSSATSWGPNGPWCPSVEWRATASSTREGRALSKASPDELTQPLDRSPSATLGRHERAEARGTRLTGRTAWLPSIAAGRGRLADFVAVAAVAG